MKKLYNILFQNEDLGEKSRELYYRSQELIVALKNKIIISDKSRISFDTYFNSFSIDKWRKYTTLNTLYLYLKIKGNCTLTIKNKYLSGHDLVEKIIKTIDIREEEISEKLFEIENINKYEGIFYFEIFSYEGETVLYEASYQTENNVKENKISIGITICTFRREEYIERMLNKYENENLDDSYKMFIVDNGKTLEYEDRKNVFFFKNKNYGGAGGFTRGIIEIQKYNQKNEEKISHILLMDDDILFDFRVLERMKSFLELKKEEFNNYFIAGSMCSLDHPEIQYESYASWRGRFFTPFKHNVNLFDVYKVLMNEKEEKYANGTAGWWFSCFSVDIIGKNNYPFPCFFRGDDVEFTIRNESKIINLNGLNVWHEPFYKKYSIVSENYYLLRNMLVVNALYTKMGYKDNSNRNIPAKVVSRVHDYKNLSWNPFGGKTLGQEEHIGYSNDGEVLWYSGFGQVEFTKNNFSAFVQGSISNQAYRRIDNFVVDGVTVQQGQVVNGKTSFKNLIGYNVKGGANYNINKNHNVFANVGFYSKQPFMNAVYPNNQQVVNPNLTNEKIFSAEVGYGFRSPKFNANLNLYRTEWKDRWMRIGNQTFGSVRGYSEINGITQVHMGVEVDATYKPVKFLELQGMFSYGDYRYKGNATGADFDESNNPVTTTTGNTTLYLDQVKVGGSGNSSIPQLTASLGATIKPISDLSIYGTWRFVGNLYSAVNTADYRTAARQDKGALRLPDYNLLDLGVSYKLRLREPSQYFTFGANVYNVIDTYYISDASTSLHDGDPNATGIKYKGIDTGNKVFFGAGRTWAASVAFNF